jgi:hypothetical protein
MSNQTSKWRTLQPHPPAPHHALPRSLRGSMLEFDRRNKKTRYRHLPQVKRVVCDEINLDNSRPLCLNILATLTDLRLLLDLAILSTRAQFAKVVAVFQSHDLTSTLTRMTTEDRIMAHHFAPCHSLTPIIQSLHKHHRTACGMRILKFICCGVLGNHFPPPQKKSMRRV